MFFVSHKRAGDEVGKNLRLQLCTVLAEVFPKPHVDRELPAGFFDDVYTFFFCFAFISLQIRCQLALKLFYYPVWLIIVQRSCQLYQLSIF